MDDVAVLTRLRAVRARLRASPHWRWMAMAVVAGGMILSVLNISIVNIALPDISRDFDANVSTAGWVVTGFLVTQAVLLPISGRAGDLYGRRRIFILGVLVMMGASVFCALAWNEPSLVIFRILQGVGASAMAPTAYSYAAILFPPHQRGLAIGLLTGIVTIAPVISLNIAGLLVGVWGWRSVFWFTPVLGVFVLVGAALVMHRRPPLPVRTFDLWGAVLAALGLFPILAALTSASAWGWVSLRTVTVFLVGVGFLALFAWRENRTPDPMLDLRLFRLATVRNATLTGFAVGAAMFGTLLLLPFYFTSVLGYSDVTLSLAISPIAVAFMIGSPLSGRLLSRVGSDRMVRVAICTAVLGALVLAVGFPFETYPLVLPGMVLLALGLSMSTAPVTATVIHEVPEDRIGVAASLPNVSRYSGGALGGALLSTVVAMMIPTSVTAENGLVAAPMRALVSDGMRNALLVAAGILAVGAIAAFRVPRVIGPGARIVARIPGRRQ
ncbi:MAG: DHA2 family efflux MFS transporter permease subunit [Thermoleophilia bacterium]|nr:DHA2 family efflux MFS transporter permease subunit [Thermoleophilia bacterium]